MTQHNPRARRWRVQLTDGTAVEIVAAKVLETAAGALMFMAADREPATVFAAAQWARCEEIRSAAR